MHININMQGYLVIINKHQKAFYLSLLTGIAINQYGYLLTTIDIDIDTYLYQDLLLSVCKETIDISMNTDTNTLNINMHQ